MTTKKNDKTATQERFSIKIFIIPKKKTTFELREKYALEKICAT